MISNKKLKGISLITLVIIIVVVIILAVAVLLLLSSNNPINNARIANIVEQKEDIEAYISKIKDQTVGQYETEDIILGNGSDIESNRIIEKDGEAYKSCVTTINGSEVTLYKLDEEKFKEQVGDLQRKPSSNSDWYLDKNGKAYLLFQSIDEVPNWMKNKEDKIDNATLNQFVVINDSCRGTTSIEPATPTPPTSLTPSGVAPAEITKDYYGKVVENYNAQGLEWKVFHSDGENIYLITSEYIPYEKIPKVNGVALNKGRYERSAYFSGWDDIDSSILYYYPTGSVAISTDNPAKKWLKSYFEDNNFSSANNNMKAVAYMLDTEKWSSFADGTYADYAIGGPTVEMLFSSYNKKHTDVDYRAEAKSAAGYEISKDGGANWAVAYSDMLDTADDLYILPEQSSTGVIAMWLASPSYYDSNGDGIIYINCSRIFWQHWL